MRFVLGCGLAVAMALSAAADDKKDAPVDAKKLVGKWSPKELPNGVTVVFEFTKDGKLRVNAEAMGKKESYEGTYKLAGNKLTVTIGKDKEKTATIVKLTDEALEVKNETDRTTVFKRAK